MQREAVIVEAVRTPIGRRDGALKDWHPVDLLAHALNAVVTRARLKPELVDDVIAGCVMQVGEQAINIARNAVLAAGFPESVPATTVDRQCGSSQQAAHFAAQGVISGAYDIAIACGVECMTRVPLGSSATGPGRPFGPAMMRRYDDVQFNQGISAEMLAERWSLSRQALDEFSLESHRRAARATEQGVFCNEIAPVGEVTKDEGIRAGTTLEKMAALKPAFKPDGVVTAGNSSQISDGAAAVLIMERGVAEKLGLTPKARFVAFALAAEDPVIMLTGPIPATRRVLERAGLDIADMDRIEINEAFASVVLAWQKETGADPAKVNVNGGAVALGHPLGASGARLMTTLVHDVGAQRQPLRPADHVRRRRHGQRHNPGANLIRRGYLDSSSASAAYPVAASRMNRTGIDSGLYGCSSTRHPSSRTPRSGACAAIRARASIAASPPVGEQTSRAPSHSCSIPPKPARPAASSTPRAIRASTRHPAPVWPGSRSRCSAASHPSDAPQPGGCPQQDQPIVQRLRRFLRVQVARHRLDPLPNPRPRLIPRRRKPRRQRRDRSSVERRLGRLPRIQIEVEPVPGSVFQLQTPTCARTPSPYRGSASRSEHLRTRAAAPRARIRFRAPPEKQA